MSDDQLSVDRCEAPAAFASGACSRNCANGVAGAHADCCALITRGSVYRADLLTVAIPHEATLAQLVSGSRMDSACWLASWFDTRSVSCARCTSCGSQCAQHAYGPRRRGVRAGLRSWPIRARGEWEEQVLARLKRSLEKIKAQHASAIHRGGLAGAGWGLSSEPTSAHSGLKRTQPCANSSSDTPAQSLESFVNPQVLRGYAPHHALR